MGAFFSGNLFSGLFSIVFLLILVVIVVNIVKGIGQWNKNNQSPRLTVNAIVVTKRADVTHHHHNHGEGGMHTSQSTSYYVTFQVESGDRMELHVSRSEYGMLVEGDHGRLSFQGTRYLGFDRL